MHFASTIQRPTRDFDILVPELPLAIVSAACAFAAAQRHAGVDLQGDWLNNGPMQRGEVLPTGWRERVHCIFVGQPPVLSTLGRPDLLKSKLFALCELWPTHVRSTVTDLARRLGHGV